MENKNQESSVVGRRRTLQLLGVGLATGGLLALSACGNKKSGGGGEGPKGGGAANSCSAPLDDAAKQSRRTLQYNDKAADPAKHCSACAQYIAGKYGDCGGCKVVGGPVQPNGGCLAFAPLGGDGGAAPATSG